MYLANKYLMIKGFFINAEKNKDKFKNARNIKSIQNQDYTRFEKLLILFTALSSITDSEIQLS